MVLGPLGPWLGTFNRPDAVTGAMVFVTVARAHEVPAGEGRRVRAGGRELALFHVGGRFFALDNACPHNGGPLAEGEVDDGAVTCPLHGWTFDLESGRHVANPAIAVRSYEVRVVGDEVQVALPQAPVV
jgi:nitrite reductase (NADH) small subunit/3-phenylpropionate/trans-cinnamate dioxygenase ferredoxin subunit